MFRSELSTETFRGKNHTALQLRKALSPAPEPSRPAGIKVLHYMNAPHYVADRSRNIETAFKKPNCIVKESDSTLEQLRQYLLKELELNGVLEKLPHDSRAVGHERLLTKSDGFTLRRSEHSTRKSFVRIHLNPLSAFYLLPSKIER